MDLDNSDREDKQRTKIKDEYF
jgi:hypothetical protein